MVLIKMQSSPTFEQVLSFRYNDLRKVAVDIVWAFLNYIETKYPHFKNNARDLSWQCLAAHTGIEAERLKTYWGILKGAEYILIIRFGFALFEAQR
jgi:hypothetical protein